MEAGAKQPEVKMPVKFLPPNSANPMNQPDAKDASNTLAPATPVIPVETLLDSMKAEKPLLIEGGATGFGAASTSSTTSTVPTNLPGLTPQQ
jgi:hypothetical protein